MLHPTLTPSHDALRFWLGCKATRRQNVEAQAAGMTLLSDLMLFSRSPSVARAARRQLNYLGALPAFCMMEG